MKIFKRTMLLALALGAVLTGCTPDGVGPSDSGKSKGLSALVGEDHPVLDTICKYSDSIFFRSVATTNLNTNNYAAGATYPAVVPTTYSYPASFYVNKCLDPDPNGIASGPLGFAAGNIIPCTTPQMKWGNFVMYNGYEYGSQDSIHWLDVDFSLANGFLCDFNNWTFAVANGIQIDPITGAPNTTGIDWNSLAVNPARNQWKVAVRVDALPFPCFDLACRMSVYRLKVNGSPNSNFNTVLWAINQRYNETGYEGASANEFSIHYCPLACLENTPPPPPVCPPAVTSTVTASVATGACLTGNMGSTTLTAVDAGITSPVYTWSTGATTRTITVSPLAATSYTVTVSNGTCDVNVVTYNVSVTVATCTNECVYLPIGWSGQLPSCATLDAGSTGVYAWSTGATSRTISVCPTATASYSVTTTNASGVSVKTFNVSVDDVRCGNSNGNNPQHKVTVCHRPPGNPGNVQMICIDWSGVPAHVAKYRSPGANYHQGHDSGCDIGRACNSNPCQ